MRADRLSRLLAVAVGVLAASGAIAIVVAVAAQSRPPQPQAGSLGTSAALDVVESISPSLEPVVQTDAPLPPPTEAGSLGTPRISEAVEPLLLPSSDPVVIEIPVIGVESPLQHLGLTAERTLEVPAPGPHYDEAAWYKYSSTPGSLGPAIILGHVDSAAGGPSVFFDLGTLQAGDEILVTRADGRGAVFGVDAVDSYPKDDFPTTMVYGEIHHAGLRLITCGGEFDRANGHYLNNIVVFASLVSSIETMAEEGWGSPTPRERSDALLE